MNYEALVQYLVSKRYCFVAGTLGNFIIYQGADPSTGRLAAVDPNTMYVSRKKAKPELFNCILSYYLSAHVNELPKISYYLSKRNDEWRLEIRDLSKKKIKYTTQIMGDL